MLGAVGLCMKYRWMKWPRFHIQFEITAFCTFNNCTRWHSLFFPLTSTETTSISLQPTKCACVSRTKRTVWCCWWLHGCRTHVGRWTLTLWWYRRYEPQLHWAKRCHDCRQQGRCWEFTSSDFCWLIGTSSSLTHIQLMLPWPKHTPRRCNVLPWFCDESAYSSTSTWLRPKWTHRRMSQKLQGDIFL